MALPTILPSDRIRSAQFRCQDSTAEPTWNKNARYLRSTAIDKDVLTFMFSILISPRCRKALLIKSDSPYLMLPCTFSWSDSITWTACLKPQRAWCSYHTTNFHHHSFTISLVLIDLRGFTMLRQWVKPSWIALTSLPLEVRRIDGPPFFTAFS